MILKMISSFSAAAVLFSVAVTAQDDNTNTDTIDATGNMVIEKNFMKGDCVVDYDPNADGIVDYFPTKYAKPTIASYGDVDIFGNKFVPHDTTDFLTIEYFNTYKIVTNSHQDPPRKYLLYQCGTDLPQDVIDADDFDVVTSVPHQGGFALTQTPQIPYMELLGLREEVVAYIGDPSYVTSPCMSYQLSPNASSSEAIETVWGNFNDTLMEELLEEFRKDHPDTIIVSGPTNNVVGDNVIIASTTQERTNVATFDWIAFYAAFFNLEGEANRISSELQSSYDCTSEVASSIVATQQTARRQMLEDDKNDEEEHEHYHTPTVFWANYFTWGDLGWSVAECPTWDTTYYCEYAAHCGATILSRPDGVGFNQTYGDSPTVYWYLNDTEAFEMGKEADIFIYSGSDWNSLYESHGDILDQFKSVQNQQVFDTLGQGPSAWNEQRYAEYDTVGLDMCDVVGHSMNSVDGDTTNAPYMRRWFRNVFTEPIGSLGTCDVAGGEINQPYVPPLYECVRPPPSPQEGAVVSSTPATEQDDTTKEESSSEQEQEQKTDPNDDSSSSSIVAYGYYSNLSLCLFLGIVSLYVTV